MTLMHSGFSTVGKSVSLTFVDGRAKRTVVRGRYI
jgi:hypothetical protein